MRKVLLITLAVFLSAAISLLFADTSGANFLTEDSSAKSFSMGSAFSAFCDTPDSLIINPAGIGFQLFPGLSASYSKNLADGYNSSIFIEVPLETAGVLGFGLTLFDMGTIDINYFNGTSASVNAMRNWTANLGYSLCPLDEISLGANIKYIKSTIADTFSAVALAADFGLLFRSLDSEFSFSLVLQNVGSQLTFISIGDSLPVTLKMGFTFRLWDTEISSCLLATEAVYYDSLLRLNTGAEFTLAKFLSIRAGYKICYNPDCLSFGIGINLSQMSLDYGYAMLGTMNNKQVFSITYYFDEHSNADIVHAYKVKGMTHRADVTLEKQERIKASNTTVESANPANEGSVSIIKDNTIVEQGSVEGVPENNTGLVIDEIFKKDGKVIEGQIVQLKQNEFIRIRVGSKVFQYKWADIDHYAIGKAKRPN